MTSTHGLFRDHPPPSHPLLTEWARSERAYIHPGVRIEEITDAGWGLAANVELEDQELLFNIPVTAILSTRNSSLPPLPNSRAITSIAAPILDLALSILHEMRLEKESRWYGYLQSLPRETILLPVFWEIPELCGDDGKKGMDWLKGTEAARDLARKNSEGLALRDLEEYYRSNTHHLPPTNAHPESSPFSAYLHTFALVTTRAFLIDLYHTIALVPFADILNHSSTNPHTSLCSDSFVCHICGSLAPCTHDILAPDGIPFRLQEASRDVADYQRMINAENAVEMRIEAHVDAGEEVMNAYGADIGDARLLVEWGYLSEEFAGDGLTWYHDELGGDETVKRIWVDLDAAALRARLQDELQLDEDSMICLPPEGPRGDNLFNLSNAGQVGSNLWSLLYISNASMSESTEGLLCNIIESIGEVESFARVGASDACGLFTKRTIEDMIRLLQYRLDQYHRPSSNLEDLFQLRDDLDPSSPLERMGMTLCINERSLLETTLHKWRELPHASSLMSAS